jgi:tetratricopeptide (TPR) repeat protein
VLDLPRLAAYLAPGAFLLAVLVGDRKTENNVSPAVVGLLGALSIILPLSYLPVYTDISIAERHTTPYFDRHNAYYRTAALSFRDAYFYRKDLDHANRWDQDYDRKSPDYLSLSGIVEFATADRLDIALPGLNKLIARNPYWAEPRALYGKYMMEQGKFAIAKPALDTAMLLDPYNPVHYTNLYAWYRDQNRFDTALAIMEDASGLFPHNREIRVDLMIVNYRSGRHDIAAALADEIIEKYPEQAYPWVIKGFLAERSGDLANAQKFFERFADMAPDAPETPQIRKRANDIYLKLSGRTP